MTEEEKHDADDEADEELLRTSIPDDASSGGKSQQEKESQKVERKRNYLDDISLQMNKFRGANTTISQIKDAREGVTEVPDVVATLVVDTPREDCWVLAAMLARTGRLLSREVAGVLWSFTAVSVWP